MAEALKPANTVLEVDRGSFQLLLFKLDEGDARFHYVKRYPIAIGFYDGPGGQPDYKTPRGWYRVNRKAKNPDWLMPDSPWIEESLRGTIIEGGDPRNPIVARWIELWNGVGIHGTAAESSIGTPASHGCIRMHVDDVIDLYDRVPKGAIVLVK